VYTHLICFSLKIHLSLIFPCLIYCLYLIGMELTDDNLRTLSDYLQHTLSPDVNIRRPGEFNLLSWTVLVSICLFLVSSQLFCMIIFFFFFLNVNSVLTLYCSRNASEACLELSQQCCLWSCGMWYHFSGLVLPDISVQGSAYIFNRLAPELFFFKF
jgi:hypothetical protein